MSDSILSHESLGMFSKVLSFSRPGQIYRTLQASPGMKTRTKRHSIEPVMPVIQAMLGAMHRNVKTYIKIIKIKIIESFPFFSCSGHWFHPCRASGNSSRDLRRLDVFEGQDWTFNLRPYEVLEDFARIPQTYQHPTRCTGNLIQLAERFGSKSFWIRFRKFSPKRSSA